MSEQRRLVTASPENSETPLDTVHGWVTPNRLFFIRNHFPVPRVNATEWRLSIGGCVNRPFELTYDDLLAMPMRSVFATMECAGNGRSFLEPRVAGVQWGAGAIGHTEWTGVPVRAILEEAGLAADALEVVFVGADRGTEPDHPQTMNFEHSLPLHKALDPATILALRMNGEVLEPDHGYPVRLLVPGWYGVVSVKWLARIEVVKQPFQGYFQTTKYTIQRRTGTGEVREVIGPMAVKSEIVRPRTGETLGIGANRIFGLAWAGESAVAAVDVSTDGGKSWQAAELLGMRSPYCWTLWEYLWEVPSGGKYQILSRARSESGEVQPAGYDPLRCGYLINFSRSIEVHVDANRRSAAQRGDAVLLAYDLAALAEEHARLPLDVELDFMAGAGI